MEGSSESGWQRSESSRGLNSSSVLERNRRFVRANTARSSGDTSSEIGFRPGRKVGDRFALPHITNEFKTYTGGSEDGVALDPVIRDLECGDISLRQWLDNPERTADAPECLHIFTQIVDIVNLAHSQGIILHNVRPSCFVMSSLNRVSFIESASCSDSGSDSFEDGMNSQTAEFKGTSLRMPPDLPQQGYQLATESLQHEMNSLNAFRIMSETSCLRSITGQAEVAPNDDQTEEKNHSFPMKNILLMETNWYNSPEEATGGPSSCASDIYRLGVLLFELFCTSSSAEEKSTIMSNLRHRVLPPQLLLKWPKEASFCLWLLHPEPSNRPKMGWGFLQFFSISTSPDSMILF